MTELTTLLRRVTDELAPEDPDRLLTAAVWQGTGLRRRRRAATTASLTGALATAAVVVSVTLAGSGHPTTTEPLTDVTVTPSHTAGDVRTAPSVTVGRADFGTTFARVVPGAITREHDVSADHVHEKGGYESTFLWNGYRVSLAMWPYRGPSHAACRDATKGSLGTQTCVRLDGGWGVRDSMMDDQDYGRWASVLRDNGFRVWVMISNSGADKGTATGGPPPLDVSDLEQVATSDLWFR